LHDDSPARRLGRGVAAADRLIAPLALFVSIYVATFIVVGWAGVLYGQWRGLASVIVATAVSVTLVDRGKWPLGLFVAPRLALRDGLLGAAFGAMLVGVAAIVVAISTELHHEPGDGFPWGEVLFIFIPAVLHEELLFRGYPFQRLARWRPYTTVFLIALAFSALHAGNANVSTLGLLNIFLGGVLLGFAFLRYGRLWFPIGLHFAWNLMLGPIAGHEVSGYVMSASLLAAAGDVGPEWVTGGAFGMEASVVMTAVELLGIALLWQRVSAGARKGVT
jgi:membrane protease YdiL (CAAX protease family)